MSAQQMSYGQRAELCENAAGKALLTLMERKKTNLSIAADVTTTAELVSIADTLGPFICVLKTHIDILLDFDATLPAKLTSLAEKHDFMIFEDRNTVMHQYRDGVYRISSWSHITNAHSVPGPGIIDGMKAVGLPLGRGLLMLAEMSSKGTLARGEYAEATVAMAKANKDFVFGFISQRCMVPDDPSFVYMTPGVQLEAGGDSLGQQYNTPESVIKHNNCDVIIVGRGIYKADDPVAAAKAYRQAGWDAYRARLGAQ